MLRLDIKTKYIRHLEHLCNKGWNWIDYKYLYEDTNVIAEYSNTSIFEEY